MEHSRRPLYDLYLLVNRHHVDIFLLVEVESRLSLIEDRLNLLGH